MKSYFKEFDIMRTIAILILMIHHLPGHSYNFYALKINFETIDFSFINDLNRYFALGSFVFIAGYLLPESDSNINRSGGILYFIVKKIIRIYPLYFIALLIFALIFDQALQKMTIFFIVAHILGLQILLCSKYCEPVFTLWYVSLIMVYYLMYILFVKYCNTLKEFICLIISTFVCAIVIISLFGFIDKRFIEYFGIFAIGIISRKYKLLKHINNTYFAFAVVVIAICTWIHATVIFPSISDIVSKPRLFSPIGFAAFCVTNIVMIAFVIITYRISLLMSSLADFKFIKIISYASFSIYLFHRPMWWVLANIWNPVNQQVMLAYLGLFGILLIICVSYYIQKIYDIFADRYIKRVLPKDIFYFQEYN